MSSDIILSSEYFSQTSSTSTFDEESTFNKFEEDQSKLSYVKKNEYNQKIKHTTLKIPKKQLIKYFIFFFIGFLLILFGIFIGIIYMNIFHHNQSSSSSSSIIPEKCTEIAHSSSNTNEKKILLSCEYDDYSNTSPINEIWHGYLYHCPFNCFGCNYDWGEGPYIYHLSTLELATEFCDNYGVADLCVSVWNCRSGECTDECEYYKPMIPG